MRILSSLRWQDPHFARTRSLRTGMPSFTAASAPGAGGAVCARAGNAMAAQTTHASARCRLPSFMKNPSGHEQRQAADHARQRYGRTTLAIRIEQIGNVAMMDRHPRERDEID